METVTVSFTLLLLSTLSIMSTLGPHAVQTASVRFNQIVQRPVPSPTIITAINTTITTAITTAITTNTPDQLRHHYKRHHHHKWTLLHRTGTVTCSEGHFMQILQSGLTVCTLCSECPVGFGVHRPCTSRADTICHKCDLGLEYQREYFGIRKCFKCRTCDNSEVLSECTPTVNRVCGACQLGYFQDDLTEGCLACSYCYPEVPGYGIVEPMCQHQNQPRAFTCLPSLPPQRLRHPKVTPSPREITLRDKIQQLDEKLRRLDQLVTSELKDVRNQLSGLHSRVKSDVD